MKRHRRKMKSVRKWKKSNIHAGKKYEEEKEEKEERAKSIRWLTTVYPEGVRKKGGGVAGV